MKKATQIAGAGVALLAAIAFFAGRAGGAESGGPEAAETPRPLGWLRDVAGNVLVGGTGGGIAASARAPIAAHDQLATEQDSRAVLDLRRSGTLVVGARSALQVLREEWDGPRLGATRVRFFRGTMRAEAGTSGLSIDVGNRKLELEGNGSARFAWEDDALAISMLKAGGVLSDRDGSETHVAAGQGVRVPRESGPAVAVALPGALASASVREKLYAKDKGRARPTFRFSGEAGRVQVVVARDEGLTEVVAEAVDAGGAVRVEEGLEPGTYFWSAARVDAVSKLSGPFTRPRPLEVLAGAGPAASDESPLSLVVVGGPSTRVFFSGDAPPPVSLDWTGISQESGYDFTVSAAGSKKTLLKGTVEESHTDLGLLKTGAYAWRVKGPDGKSQAGSFILKRASGGPAKVKRTSRIAEEFDRATVYFQREAPSVEFAWKADTRAAKYRLIVSKDKTFATPPLVERKDLTTALVVVEAGTLPEGDAYWRVQRLKLDGTVFYPGKVQMLSVKFDLENPSLELGEPAEGASVGGDEVMVSGLAPRDAAIWVNGVPIAPSSRGRFAIRAKLDGPNPLVVVKTARSGAKDVSYFVRSLKRTGS